jgi:hypothetical protein
MTPIVNPRIGLTAIPILVFLLLSRGLDSWLDVPAWVAILGGFIASGGVFLFNRRDRVMGMLTVFGFVIVALSAIVGIAWDSEKAYLASGPISDFAFVPLYGGCILIGRPLIGLIARELFPAWGQTIPLNDRVFVWLSLAWALYDLAHGLVRIWLLGELSTTEYIFISRIVSWPFSAALLGITVRSIYRASQRHTGAGAVVPLGVAAAETG